MGEVTSIQAQEEVQKPPRVEDPRPQAQLPNQLSKPPRRLIPMALFETYAVSIDGLLQPTVVVDPEVGIAQAAAVRQMLIAAAEDHEIEGHRLEVPVAPYRWAGEDGVPLRQALLDGTLPGAGGEDVGIDEGEGS